MATKLTVVEKEAETTSKSNLFSLGRELLEIELSRVGWSMRRLTLQNQSTQTNQQRHKSQHKNIRNMTKPYRMTPPEVHEPSEIEPSGTEMGKRQMKISKVFL